MPTYEYECTVCGFRVDYFQRMSDAPKTVCPACEAADGLRRLISSGAGVIFRGSGFYETDYRTKEYREKAKKEKESATSSSESKKDGTKPAATGSKESSPAATPAPAERATV